MKYVTRAAQLLLISFLFITGLSAQTAGSGYVSSIESKANQISKNDEKVSDLNQQHLQTYSDEQEKLKRLNRELGALIDEKNEAMREMRLGRFCNGCNQTASQLRRGGTYDVEDHFRRNGGTHSATPAELEKKEAEYNAKIERKQNEIDKFKEGENEFSRKRADLSKQMDRLKESSDQLRQEIVDLSKQYKDKILDEAKAMHKFWVGGLMRIIAEKHYIEDRINILQVKVTDLGKEETQAIAEFEDKLRKKNEEAISNLEKKINANKNRAYSLEQSHESRIDPLERNLADLKSRLNEVNQELRSISIDADEKTKLDTEKASLEQRIASGENQLNEYETSFKNEIQSIEDENKKFADDIWKLKTTEFSKLLDEGLQHLKKAFTAKRKILNDAISAKRNSLEEVGRSLMDEREVYRKKNNEYIAKVDAERIRMMNACSKAGASCYGTDAVSAVVGNWSKVSGCVGEMEAAHHSDDVIYGCEEETKIYRQYYRQNKSGMSAEDQEALNRNDARTRYDMIFKKITD